MDYEEFLAVNNNGRRRGGFAQWARDLPVGEPLEIPSKFGGKSSDARLARTAIDNALKYTGETFKVSVRTIDGRVWVCHLKPEDTK